jgi:hypothetical protein
MMSNRPHMQWLAGILKGLKRPERQVDHLPPSGNKVTNDWSYMPLWCEGR